jgi:hypothetical protein
MKIGKPNRMPPSACTACGTKLNGATGIATDGAPSPGDITVCLSCGHVMAYADDLTLRDLTDAEMVEIAGDPRLVAFNKVRGAL